MKVTCAGIVDVLYATEDWKTLDTAVLHVSIATPCEYFTIYDQQDAEEVELKDVAKQAALQVQEAREPRHPNHDELQHELASRGYAKRVHQAEKAEGGG